MQTCVLHLKNMSKDLRMEHKREFGKFSPNKTEGARIRREHMQGLSILCLVFCIEWSTHP